MKLFCVVWGPDMNNHAIVIADNKSSALQFVIDSEFYDGEDPVTEAYEIDTNKNGISMVGNTPLVFDTMQGA